MSIFMRDISPFIVLIGISRLTLGVHYFSDVLAGYAAGGLWLSVCITGIETLRRRRSGQPVSDQQSAFKHYNLIQ